MKKVREEDGDTLLLEIGDALAGTDRIAEIKANAYAEVFRYMAYDAVGIGDMELRSMKESDRRNPYGDSLPVVCANVVDASTGKLLLPKPYLVKKTDHGLKVGIIAVLGQEQVDSAMQERLGIRVLPPADELRQWLVELEKKSDIVILLSHTGYLGAKALASEVRGLDVVLSGHPSGVPKQDVEQSGEPVLMHSMQGGKYVGKLVLDIDENRRIASSSGQFIAMNGELPDEARVAEIVAKHDGDLRDYYMSFRSKGAVNAQGTTVPSALTTGESVKSRRSKEPSAFASSQTCRECHPEQYDSWSKSAHARAFESLKRDKKTSDLECVGCHTTGFNSKGGFLSETATPQFLGVQCEACHGPGAEHSRRPDEGYGVVGETACTRCHDPGHSPEFEYKAYKNRLDH